MFHYKNLSLQWNKSLVILLVHKMWDIVKLMALYNDIKDVWNLTEEKWSRNKNISNPFVLIKISNKSCWFVLFGFKYKILVFIVWQYVMFYLWTAATLRPRCGITVHFTKRFSFFYFLFLLKRGVVVEVNVPVFFKYNN